MKSAFFVVLAAMISISVGFAVLGLASMYYAGLESQGPYSYEVSFGEGIQAKDLGVVVNLNLSRFAGTSFVGEDTDLVLEVSAEKDSSMVQNFSWRIFWVELFAFRDRTWLKVAHGSAFLDESEWSDLRLYRHIDVSVGVVNLNYLESVGEAWFRIGIVMDVFYNKTSYSLTFYTPMGGMGPVSILSPVYSPASLATISAAATAGCTTLAHQLLGKTALISKKPPSLANRERE